MPQYDVVIPLAFPDYTIEMPDPVPAIPIPKGPQKIPLPDTGIPGIPRTVPITVPDQINLPDLPLIDIPGVPGSIPVPDDTRHIPMLGHAGVIFFNGATGVTKYYDYGRYPNPPQPTSRGIVRNQRISDVILSGGRPTRASLTKVLKEVSDVAGHHTRIAAVYVTLPAGAFNTMLQYCIRRLQQNSNVNRKAYDILWNSCCHFMRDVAVAGGVNMPGVTPPNPSLYIERVRWSFPNLDYYPSPPVALCPAAGF